MIADGTFKLILFLIFGDGAQRLLEMEDHKLCCSGYWFITKPSRCNMMRNLIYEFN